MSLAGLALFSLKSKPAFGKKLLMLTPPGPAMGLTDIDLFARRHEARWTTAYELDLGVKSVLLRGRNESPQRMRFSLRDQPA